jgi:hypothetical protein
MSDADEERAREARRKARANWPTRVIRPGDDVDVDAEDLRYWLSVPPAERFLFVKRLSAEIWEWVKAGQSRER